LQGETQGLVFRPTSGNRFSPSQGETERVLLAGGRRSSSGERQQRSCLPGETQGLGFRLTSENRFSAVKGKTPLVLPRKLSGERRKGRCFAQPPETGSLPRRERQRGSSFVGGRRSSSGERQRGSPDAKSASVKGSGPAIDPSNRGSLRRAAPGPPLAPHRARPGRGTGARKRPRTPVVFFFWFTYEPVLIRASGLRTAPMGCLTTVHRLASDLGP